MAPLITNTIFPGMTTTLGPFTTDPLVLPALFNTGTFDGMTFTAPVAGVYSASGGVSVPESVAVTIGTTVPPITLNLEVNGTIVRSAGIPTIDVGLGTVTLGGASLFVAADLNLAAGDTVKLSVSNNTTLSVTLGVATGPQQPLYFFDVSILTPPAP
jgi:hypothetical protein